MSFLECWNKPGPLLSPDISQVLLWWFMLPLSFLVTHRILHIRCNDWCHELIPFSLLHGDVLYPPLLLFRTAQLMSLSLWKGLRRVHLTISWESQGFFHVFLLSQLLSRCILLDYHDFHYFALGSQCSLSDVNSTSYASMRHNKVRECLNVIFILLVYFFPWLLQLIPN